MPVTNPIHRVRLIQEGLDPDQFDEMVPQEPVVQQPVNNTPPADTTSATQSILENAAANVPSTLTALASGAAGANLLSRIPGPPLVKGIGGVLGAIGGAYTGGRYGRELQDYAIDRFAPESLAKRYNTDLETTRREHPIASRIGDILPNLLAMRPSLGGLKSASELFTKPLTGVIPTAENVGNAVNTTLGATTPLINSAMSGQNPIEDIKQHPLESALEAITGGVINNPRKWTSVLGMHPTTITPKVGEGLANRLKSSEPVIPEVKKPIALLPENAQSSGDQRIYANEAAASTDLNKLNPSLTTINEQLKDTPPTYNVDANGNVTNEQTGQPAFQTPQELADYQKAKAEHDLAKEKLKQQTQDLQKQTSTMVDALQPSTVTPEPSPKDINFEAPNTIKAPAVDALKPSTIAPPLPTEPSPKDINYQSKSELATAGKEVTKGLEKQNLPTQPTEEWNNFWKDFSKRRNVTIDNSGRIFDNTTGKEVNGQSFVRDGLREALVKINPNKAQLDTIPHELFHTFFNDMKQLGNPRDQALMNRATRVIQESPEYADWAEQRSNKGMNPSVEEYLTNLTGIDSIRRLLNTDSTGNIKNWFRDFWAYQKTKYGMGSNKDVTRVMSNKLLNDPTFKERFGGEIANPNINLNNKPENQEESDLLREHNIQYNPNNELNKVNRPPNYDILGETPLQKLFRNNRDVVLEKGAKRISYHEPTILGEPKNQDESPFTPEDKAKGAKVQDEQQRLLEEYNTLKSKIQSGNPKEANESYKKLDEISNKLQQLNAPEPYKNQDESVFESQPKKPSDNIQPKVVAPKAETTIEETKRPYIPGFLKSEVDKIADINTPSARAYADNADKFYSEYKFNKGQLEGNLTENLSKQSKVNLSSVLTGEGKVKDYAKNDSPLLQSSYNKMLDQFDNPQKQVKFTPEEQSIRSAIQTTMKTVRDMLRKRPEIRTISEDDPNYIPQIINPEKIKILSSDRNSPESLQLQKDFLDYQTKRLSQLGTKDAAKVAEGNLEKILQGYNNKSVDVASQYGPLDKAQGIGLPPSWREPNLLKALHKYLDRVSRRFAYNDTFQKSPKALEALMQHQGNKSLQTVNNDIIGNTPQQEKYFSGAQGIARSLQLGTLTGLRDVTTALTLGWQHQQNPLQVIKTTLGSLSNLKQYINDGVANGRIRHNINSLEWSDTEGTLRRISDISSDIQGRNFLERISRGFSTGVGELTTLDYLEQLNQGKLSAQGKDWFEKFGKDVDWKKGSLSNEELLKVAGRFTDSNQGSYDYTGLPKYTKEGSLSPFLSLARWNVEKANNYFKHVIDPLRNGNPTPFLMSTVGMILGGAAVKKLTESITGRKDTTATVDELKNTYAEGKPIKGALSYKLLGLASASGYLGIVTDIAKSLMDRMYAKQKPRWYNNLLLESAQSAEQALGSLVQGIDENGFDPEIFAKFGADFLADNFQTARIIMNHIGEGEQKLEKSNKLRDLRSFNLLEGNDVTDLSSSDYSPKYENLKASEFKNEEDLGKAEKMLPELLKQAFEKSNGDPEKLQSELEKLKKNSYSTMPSPENMPIAFRNYLAFLTKTQGKDAAVDRYKDYLLHSIKNEVKSGVIP